MTISVLTSSTPCMRSTVQQSICAFHCFRGRIFARPKRLSKCTRFSICEGRSPSFIHVSNGKMGDALTLDLITVEAGAIYVMDRGYIDFRRLYVIHQAGAFFVTRTKTNMKFHRVYSHAVDKTTVWAVTRALRSTDFIRSGTILSTCGVSRSAIRKQASVWCS